MENNASTSVGETKEQNAKRQLPWWVIVMAFAILLAFIGLIGWGLNRSMRGSMSPGSPAPQFTLVTFDGKLINTADYAGKVVVVNFWASWCKPCEQEARELEQAYQHYKPGGQVIFLGLAYVDTEANSLEYLKKFGITYPNGPDLETKVSNSYNVKGVPETFIIDRQGKLAYFKAGPFLTLDEIIGVVDSIANKD